METEETQTEVETKKSVFTEVTPLSKYLAMALFVLMPFIGGYIGYKYSPEKIVEVEKVVIKEVGIAEVKNEPHNQVDETRNVTEEYYNEFIKQSDKSNWQILDQLDVGEYDAIIAAPFRNLRSERANSNRLIEQDNCYYPAHYVYDDAVLFYATSSLELGEIGVPWKAFSSWWTVSNVRQGGLDNTQALIEWRLLGISNHLEGVEDNNSFSVLDYAKLTPRSVQELLENTPDFMGDGDFAAACQWEGNDAVRKYGYLDRLSQDDVGRELLDREVYGEVYGENHDNNYIYKNYSVSLSRD